MDTKCYQNICFTYFLRTFQIYGLTKISIRISKPCNTTQDELAKLFHQCIKNDFRYFLCTTTYCPLGIHNDDSCKTNWFPLLPFSPFIGQNISFMLSSRFQLREACAMTNMYIHAFSRSKMIFKANLLSRLTIF